MLQGTVSFVKAVQDFFTDNSDGFGRKVTLEEFKELTPKDRADMRDGLIAIGYDVEPLKV